MTEGNLSVRDWSLLAAGWDAAIAAMQYEDGSSVELVEVVNPYRRADVPKEGD